MCWASEGETDTVSIPGNPFQGNVFLSARPLRAYGAIPCLGRSSVALMCSQKNPALVFSGSPQLRTLTSHGAWGVDHFRSCVLYCFLQCPLEIKSSHLFSGGHFTIPVCLPFSGSPPSFPEESPVLLNPSPGTMLLLRPWRSRIGEDGEVKPPQARQWP